MYFCGLRQVSGNHWSFSPVLLQSCLSPHLYFSRHVSFKRPCGTKQCLSTCRWFQWNLCTLLFRAPNERQTGDSVHPYVWVLVNLHVCWGSVYVMLYEVNLPRHLAGKRIYLSHKCWAISNVSLEKDPNPLYHCSGYPSACGGRRGERKNKERGRVELEHS